MFELAEMVVEALARPFQAPCEATGLIRLPQRGEEGRARWLQESGGDVGIADDLDGRMVGIVVGARARTWPSGLLRLRGLESDSYA